MDFNNLDSEETLQNALNWVSDCVQNAMKMNEKSVTFTFSPNEQNTIEKIFDFVRKIAKVLGDYEFRAWCILDNENEQVKMKVML